MFVWVRMVCRKLSMVEKRIRSVLVLSVTVSLLFYYTFENEIDMLNSYAETELLPQISRGNVHGGGGGDGVLKDEGIGRGIEDGASELSDVETVVQKNRYFPLLLEHWEMWESEVARPALPKQLNYWTILPKVFLKTGGGGVKQDEDRTLVSRGVVQADHDGAGTGEDKMKLAAIKAVFDKDWELYKQSAWGHDYVRPLSRAATDSTHFATTMILSLEAHYLMGAQDEVSHILEYLSTFNFELGGLPAQWKATTDPTLGALLGAYELIQNPILLEKAEELANIIIHAFDTPPFVPLVPFDVHSPLRNRYPYRRSAVAELAGVSVEFTRLTQLTKNPKYFNAVYNMYSMARNSNGHFDLPGLITDFVDPSGCELATIGDDNAAAAGMKTIYNGKYVNCLSVNAFQYPAGTHNTGADNAVSDAAWVHENRVEYYSWDGLEAWYRSLLEMSQLIVDPEFSEKFGKMFTDAMNAIIKYMLFEPALPKPNSSEKTPQSQIRLLSSVRTWSHDEVLEHSNIVKVMRQFDMSSKSCSFPGMLALASKVFPEFETQYITAAKEVLEGCFRIHDILGVIPSSLHLDVCPEPGCFFDSDAKRQKIKDGYYNENNGKKAIVDGIKITQSSKDRLQDDDSEEEQQEAQYVFVDGALPYTLNLESWDENRPLFINAWNNTYNLDSNLVESLFYMYRITGDSSWRQVSWSLWESTMNKLTEHSAKGYKELKTSTYEDVFLDTRADQMPPEWFSKTLKYYYLMFSNESQVANLNEWIISSKGNMFHKPT
ncbi:putative mannosidase MNL2 Ecym_1503 [Eremothecium cymbalariae DBVPG|uniref:Alpha-1,2-Mannosidase n=1 Tax=Eremothecium cymbalariae (strain CBS 270.75 / DBVPG 7215 / KCTC 17166 / NRRL Y-17582) TaxID=931890 RepID=G8JMR2_ERECY|nr:hypothetical protein Ecym_1503 [Eremothecium cymbalariae DBVPG\